MKRKPAGPRIAKYFFELLACVLGFTLIYCRIEAEIDHRVSIGYNRKGLMTVVTGAYTALLGLLIVISSLASAYGKRKRK